MTIVEKSISDAWYLVRSRPWSTIGLQLPIVALPALAIGASEASLSALATGRRTAAIETARAVGTSALALLLLVAPLLVALAVGYLALALWRLRGESPPLRTVLAGLRVLPALFVFGAVVLLAAIAVAILLAVPIAAVGIAGQWLEARAAEASSIVPVVGIGMLSGVAAGLSQFAVALLLAAVALGIGLWPLVAIDRRAGLAQALRASWSMTRGHRLALASLLIAAASLNQLGLLAFGVGVLFTNAIAMCAIASFYEQIRHQGELEPGDVVAPEPAPAPESGARPETLPDVEPAPTVAPGTDTEPSPALYPRAEAPRPRPGAPRRRWSSFAVDLWLLVQLAAYLLIGVLIATVAPLLAIARARWLPYGSGALLVPVLLTPLFALALYWVATLLLRERPGSRVAGDGWGRFEWLAWPVMAATIILALPAVQAGGQAARAIAQMGVADELARQLVADLPAGMSAWPRREGTSEIGDAGRLARITYEGGTWTTYAISDRTGADLFFGVTWYEDEQAAAADLARIGGPSARRADGWGDEALLARGPENVARGAFRKGRIVVAGETTAEHEAALRELLALQAANAAGAIASTAPVRRIVGR